MTNKKMWIVAVFLMAGCLYASDFQHPVMRVPKTSVAPVIDGQLSDGEWANAAAFTGVTAEGAVGGHGSLVPKVQQVQWFISYDDKFLYLAMRSRHPKGAYPVARVKQNDLVGNGIGVLFEDHVEIQILSHGRRDLASTQGKGFYKIMVNPKAAYVDQFMYNGTIGTEELWSTGGPIKCHVTDETWELELAVELDRINVKSLDARDLVIQLVRTDSCAGMYYAGWVGEAWMAWDKFARVDFSEDAPAFRFLELGEIGAGDLNVGVELVGGKQPATVTTEVTVESFDGKTIYSDSKTTDVPAGATASVSFKQAGLEIPVVSITDRSARNKFKIRSVAEVGDETIVLYENESPFVQMDEEFETNFLKPWIAGRPQSGAWEYSVAYMPYHNKLEAGVDLDFFGVPAELDAAATFEVAVRPKKGLLRRVIAKGGGEVVNKVGAKQLIDLPELEAGEYVAEFTLRDQTGKVLSEQSAEFKREKFEWEHNTLGMSDEVIRPFEPIKVKGNQVSVWGRTYAMNSGGLPGQINVDVPTGTIGRPQNLLAAPMKFEVIRNGKAVAAKGSSEIVAATDARVDMKGAQRAGAISVDIESFIEYDGWCEVAADFQGLETVDAVDLVIDLKDQPGLPIDTLYAQRLTDGRTGNRFSEIPAAPGVCFESTELLDYTGGTFDWKSFVPRTFVGSGDRGLWFFAWSAGGWELADDQAVVKVERLKNGNVQLRVRLLAGPVDLSKGRKLRFALQAAPVKPNHPRYRSFWDENIVAHDTRGWRYYGNSINDYVTESDDEREALRKFLLYGQRYQGEEQRDRKDNYKWWSYGKALGHGAAFTAYGSGQLVGYGADEFQTFGGEWAGQSNWPRTRNGSHLKGRYNYQGTVQWLSDEQITVEKVEWTPSMIDFFVWYHKSLMEQCGFNGTWWDNISTSTSRVYNEETGAMEEIWMLYPRRQLLKRLNTLGWELMRPPRWASNMHVDLGWNQIFWMVENDWYADGKDMTVFDQWSLGMFRAMARTKSTMQVARIWTRGYDGTTPEKDRQVRRSLWGMMMSHDLFPEDAAYKKFNFEGTGGRDIWRTFSRLQGLVDLNDTADCLFAGYWQSENMVAPVSEDLLISVYQNAKLRTAAVVLFNEAREDRTAETLILDVKALTDADSVTCVFDVETGETLETEMSGGRCIVKTPLTVNAQEFRLIGVE